MSAYGITTLSINEPLIFEQGSQGRCAFSLPKDKDIPQGKGSIPGKLFRSDIKGFPEVSEVELVRHFTRLSVWNYGVDTGFYPLGSCTMKYNPKANEEVDHGHESLHTPACCRSSRRALWDDARTSSPCPERIGKKQGAHPGHGSWNQPCERRDVRVQGSTTKVGAGRDH